MTYKQIIPAFWSFLWRSTLVGVSAALAAGFIAGFVAGFTGYVEYSEHAGGVAGWIATVLVSLWAFRAAIIKHKYVQIPTAEEQQRTSS